MQRFFTLLVLFVFMTKCLYQVNGQAINTLTVNSPDGIKGNYEIVRASFGSTSNTPITAFGGFADDGNTSGTGGTINDACSPVTNSLTGKIGFVDRGVCSFDFKSNNVYKAGAIAVIICQNATNASVWPFQAGVATQAVADSVKVPVFTLSHSDCQKIRASVINGSANITLRYFYNCTNKNPNYGANVVWGKNPGQGDFTGGLNDWVVDKPNTWEHNPTGQITKQNFSADVNVNSFTTCNGVAEFNSDWLDNRGTNNFGSGLCPSLTSTGSSGAPPCIGELISPVIDLTGTTVNGITIEFSQAYRNFSSDHYLIASKNGGQTWTDTIKINDEANIYNGRTKVALRGYAGVTKLRFKFRYESQYYYWAIDDVVVINEVITDVRINRNFFSVAPTLRVPKSQVSPMPFLADVSNIGNANASDVSLDVVIRSNNQTVKTITNTYGNLASGNTIENKLFPETFTPPANVASYNAFYIIRAKDEIPSSNDTTSFNFEITENTFANLLPEDRVTPANYMEDITGFWAVDADITNYYSGGNVYYMQKGNGFTVDKVRFGLENTKAEIDGKGFVVVDLFEWNDLNNDGESTVNERKLVGTNNIFIENIPNLRKIEIPLWRTDAEGLPEENKKISLKDTTTYLLMAHTNPLSASSTRFKFLSYSGFSLTSSFDRSIYQSATNLALDLINRRRNSGSLWQLAGNNGTFEDMRGRFFERVGNDVTLHSYANMYLEMDIASASSTYEIATDAEAKIYPNPASTELFIDLALPQVSKNVKVDLVAIDGKIASSTSFQQVQNASLRVDVNSVVSGTYNALIHTDAGVITRKVIIQKQ